jgi:hypothetical protein
MDEPPARLYAPEQRPDVEVRVGDQWLPAELRSWSPSPSGWWANCSYHRGPGQTNLGTFQEGDVREDTIDRSFGRDD